MLKTSQSFGTSVSFVKWNGGRSYMTLSNFGGKIYTDLRPVLAPWKLLGTSVLWGIFFSCLSAGRIWPAALQVLECIDHQWLSKLAWSALEVSPSRGLINLQRPSPEEMEMKHGNKQKSTHYATGKLWKSIVFRDFA